MHLTHYYESLEKGQLKSFCIEFKKRHFPAHEFDFLTVDIKNV